MLSAYYALKGFVVTFLSLTLLAITPLLRLKRWRVIHCVNAGTSDDFNSFYRYAWARSIALRFVFVPISFIHSPAYGWSIVLATSKTNKQLRSDHRFIKDIVQQIGRWKCDRVSLNGVMPSAADTHKAWPSSSNISNSKYGTTYMLIQNIKQITQIHGYTNPKIAVIGCGRAGQLLIQQLTELDYSVLGFDISPKENIPSNVYVGCDFSKVASCQIIILLTERGNSGLSVIKPYLLPGQTILSDTHPKPSPEAWDSIRSLNCHIYEAATTLEGLAFFPALPSWRPDTMPGCAVQAITESIIGTDLKTYDDFDQKASEVGVKSRLDTPV